MVKCDNCGASIEESDNFCMNCGNKIEKNNEHDILPLVTLIKCPNCKKQILNEWKYCRFCGYDTSQPSGTSLIKKIVDDVAYNSNVLRFCTTSVKNIMTTQVSVKIAEVKFQNQKKIISETCLMKTSSYSI